MEVVSERIDGHDLNLMFRDGFLRIICQNCKHIFYAWPNRNNCPCHRARCLRCKNGPSYAVTMVKLNNGWRARQYVYSDTYEDYLNAVLIDRSQCVIVKETE